MAYDDKELVERLRKRREAEMIGGYERIEWEDEDALEAADRIEVLTAENEWLREAGKDLGFYAGHDDSCDCVKGWAKGPCNCGYTETWKQWSAALGETK